MRCSIYFVRVVMYAFGFRNIDNSVINFGNYRTRLLGIMVLR